MQLSEYIEREQDVITGVGDLEFLYDFPQMPVYMGVTNEERCNDLMAQMSWWISRESGCVQLKKLIPLEILYHKSHGSGTMGKIWLSHHEAFAKFISKYCPTKILEIGGGHGLLSKEFLKDNDAEWTILEPNPSPKEGVRAKYINGFVDDEFNLPQIFDAIVHSHVLEHIYNPCLFLANISRIMPIGSWQFCSFPNMRVMFEKSYTNMINFEHTYLLLDTYAEYMFTHANYIIIDKYYFNDHSIFYALRKTQNIKPQLQLGEYETIIKYFFNYISNLKTICNKFNIYISKINNDSNLFIFGAHVFTQILVSFGLDESKIAYILDNDKYKWGLRLSGTNLYVKNPEIIKTIYKPYILLAPSIYNVEIKEQFLAFNSSCVFIE